MNTSLKQNLLVELFVEELPPKALQSLGQTFAQVLFERLQALGLAAEGSVVTAYASPRRLAAHITHVLAKAPDQQISRKLMPVAVGLDSQGNATAALLKKLQALGADASAVQQLRQVNDGKNDVLFFDTLESGALLHDGLQQAFEAAISHLPIPKVMRYQLSDGWTTVHFVRPVHAITALHGQDIIPLQALGLTAGRITHGHRFEARKDPIEIRHADTYVQQLKEEGSVIASFEARRLWIQTQLNDAARAVGNGVRPIHDAALLDEVTALVEHPHVLICEFEQQFLEVPQECLILTMKANQKYFPLLDSDGRLTNKFLVVSNITPDDVSAVVEGNERVVRPRLADAKFFYDQDRKKTLASREAAYAKVIYLNKLGTRAQRVARIRQVAQAIAAKLGANEMQVMLADLSARLSKADLFTDMVGEFPELQGIMGRYYALHDGLPLEVANAIEDHYKPRFAGDELPREFIGVVVALADKLETLVGMFGIGNIPTGDKDPFALRRCALGIVRILMERELPLPLDWLLETTASTFVAGQDGVDEKFTDQTSAIASFMYERIAAAWREQGYSAQEIEALLSMHPQLLNDLMKRLEAVRAFVALPEAVALASANKRVVNILKKASLQSSQQKVDVSLLKEPAEQALYAALEQVQLAANNAYDDKNYTQALQELAVLKQPVDAFFEAVMVNVDDESVRNNRLSLLKQLQQLMNRIADLSCLAQA